jgi:predicted nucleic acid-binding protein
VRIIKIYLDTCCYNRPFDDLSREYVKSEAESVLKIIELSTQYKLQLVSSEFVKYEISQIKDSGKRNKILEIYNYDEFYVLTNQIESLAKYYRTFNLKTFDSLHLATAEVHNIDVLLTTDSDFIKYSERFYHKTKVLSPLSLILEEEDNAT